MLLTDCYFAAAAPLPLSDPDPRSMDRTYSRSAGRIRTFLIVISMPHHNRPSIEGNVTRHLERSSSSVRHISSTLQICHSGGSGNSIRDKVNVKLVVGLTKPRPSNQVDKPDEPTGRVLISSSVSVADVPASQAGSPVVVHTYMDNCAGLILAHILNCEDGWGFLLLLSFFDGSTLISIHLFVVMVFGSINAGRVKMIDNASSCSHRPPVRSE